MTWILETIDLYKDIVYFYSFPHSLVNLILLAISVALPFGLFHKQAMKNGQSYGKVHSLIIYLGFTDTSIEKKARREAAIKIAMFENLIQFIVPFFEIFVFQTTVTWMQAGFPIFTLMMINKTIAPELAAPLYIKITNLLKDRPLFDKHWDTYDESRK